MDRRALIAWIGAVTGCAFLGPDRLAAAAGASPEFSARDLALLDEISETIIPRTDTPGAKDAGVGAFIARYAAACYPPDRLEILQRGLADIDVRMREAHGVDFLHAPGGPRDDLLVQLDALALAQSRAGADALPHYFTLMKQLTLFGFFTSEAGATQVLRNRPVPGPYRGCVPYRQGDSFWS